MTALLIPYVVALHTFGALIGAGVVTFAEFFYTLAAADGVIDHHERKYLRRIFHGLRYGMVLVLLSGVALIVLEYLVPDAPQDVLTAPFWALQTLTVFVLVLAGRLTMKSVPWWFASAGIFTAWWMMLFNDLGYFNAYGYVTLLVCFILATFIVAGILGYAKVLVRSHKK